MANDNVTVESRYLKYNKAEVETLLDKVNDITTATAEDVRGIVKNYMRGAETEPGE